MMDYCYKVEMVLDKKKIDEGNKYTLGAIVRAFNDAFRQYPSIVKLKTENENELSFAVKKHEDFSSLRVCVMNAYRSVAKPYFMKLTFEDAFENESEDLLAEYERVGLGER